MTTNQLKPRVTAVSNGPSVLGSMPLPVPILPTPASLSPWDRAEQARAARINGTMGEKEYMETMQRMGPLINSPVAHTPRQDTIQEQMDALRRKRMEGKINEAEFHRRMSEFGRRLQSGA